MKSGERFDGGGTGSDWRWRMRDGYNQDTVCTYLKI